MWWFKRFFTFKEKEKDDVNDRQSLGNFTKKQKKLQEEHEKENGKHRKIWKEKCLYALERFF